MDSFVSLVRELFFNKKLTPTLVQVTLPSGGEILVNKFVPVDEEVKGVLEKHLKENPWVKEYYAATIFQDEDKKFEPGELGL